MERYKTYSGHLKQIYGEKVYKLPVNLPVTCPNRMDGDGCSFCGGVGTGFEAMNCETSVSEQLLKRKDSQAIQSKKIYCVFSKLYEHISSSKTVRRIYDRSSQDGRYCWNFNINKARLHYKRLS